MTINTNTKKIYRVLFLFLWLLVVDVSAAPLIHWADTPGTTNDSNAQKNAIPNGLYNLPRSLWNEKNLVGPFLAVQTLRPLLSEKPEKSESLWDRTLEKISLGGMDSTDVLFSKQRDPKIKNHTQEDPMNQDAFPILEANLWPLFCIALAFFIFASLRVSAQKAAHLR